MSWWAWTILGAVIYLTTMFFVWTLLKAAGDEDERMGRK